MAELNPLDAATELELQTLDAYIFEGSWKGAAHHIRKSPRTAQRRIGRLSERVGDPGLPRLCYWRGLQRCQQATHVAALIAS